MTKSNDFENDILFEDPTEIKYDNFYLKLRSMVSAYVEKHTNSKIAAVLLYVPDFFYLLLKLSTDPRVPSGNKAQIIAALAYFFSPLDVIFDFIPGVGLLDDLYLAMIVTDNLLNAAGIGIVKEYWPGDDNIVQLIKNTLDYLNEKLGAGAIKRILAKLCHTDEVNVPTKDDIDSCGTCE